MISWVWGKAGLRKLSLLFGLTLLFGLGEGMGAQISLLTHSLTVLNDQYYVIFVVLPVILFPRAGEMEDDTLLVLMRYGTHGRYLFHKWLALSSVATLFRLG